MIKVKAPCRLHLGQLDLNGSLGRIYGGIGVALEGPKTVIYAEPAAKFMVEGPVEEKDRVIAWARAFLAAAGIKKGVRLLIDEVIPPHVGLGSGTQLALSVGVALAQLFETGHTVKDVAIIGGRGRQSGVGIGVFERGGLVVDGGVLREFDSPEAPGYVPPIVFRHDFPLKWCFLVVIPDKIQGYSGQREQQAFGDLPPIPAQVVGCVCRLLVMQLLPALIEQDIEAFGQAVTEIQQLIGQQFGPVQGGLYNHPAAEKIVRWLVDFGATGVGQSSWGPTLYAIAKSRLLAEGMKRELEKQLRKEQVPAQVLCLSAQNRGAQIITTS